MSTETTPLSLRWARGAPPSTSLRTSSPRMPAAASDVSPLEAAVVERLRRGTMALPLLPDVAAAVAALAAAGDADRGDLLELLVEDPVLMGRFLSAACADDSVQGRRVSTARDALDRLGLPAARDLLFRLTHAPGPSMARFRREIEASARRSRRCAAAAQAIALRVPLAGIGDPYLVGLLQDLGELRVWRALAELPTEAPLEAARAVVARLHQAAGADVAHVWRLPPWIQEVCRAHHAPMASPSANQRLAAASSALVDATVHGLSRGRLAVLGSIGASPALARDLVARLAPGRNRAE